MSQLHAIAKQRVTTLYLDRDQTYRGHVVLIFTPRHVARLDQLSLQEWLDLAADLYAAQRAVVKVVAPDHVNTESLGNVVAHLHWHVFPRYRADPRWRQPVWMTNASDMPRQQLAEQEFLDLAAAIGAALERS
ncbi:MAG: HIT family protein [Steroidobacteraceae bacterium]